MQSQFDPKPSYVHPSSSLASSSTSLASFNNQSTPANTTSNGFSNFTASKSKNSKCAIVRPLNEPKSEPSKAYPPQASLQYPSDQKMSHQELYASTFLPIWPLTVNPFTI